MKTLTFIRHAKSDWDDPTLKDFNRPLNQRGRRDAPEMGKRMLKRLYVPQAVFLSNSLRTRQTMELFIAEAKWKRASYKEEAWMYEAQLQRYLKYIESLNHSLTDVCFCGHNPTITEIVNYFTGGNISNIPTCGIAQITFKFDQWRMLSSNTGNLTFFDFPKNS